MNGFCTLNFLDFLSQVTPKDHNPKEHITVPHYNIFKLFSASRQAVKVISVCPVIAQSMLNAGSPRRIHLNPKMKTQRVKAPDNKNLFWSSPSSCSENSGASFLGIWLTFKTKPLIVLCHLD